MLEKQLTNKIIKSFNERPDVWFYKRFASGNEAGKPDITGIFDGTRVEIEVKAPRLLNRQIQALEEAGDIDGLFSETLKLASKRQAFYIKKRNLHLMVLLPA